MNSIITGLSDDSRYLVENFHYSGYVPSNIQYVFTEYEDRSAIATCMFSIPSTRWKEQVLELCRLVRKDDININLTSLISRSIKEIKKENRFNLLVSFADSTHNHFGGIYQAASWNFHQLRKPQHDGFIIDGRFVCRRTCNHRYGTSSRRLVEVLSKEGKSISIHFDSGKYLYWKSINNSGKNKAKRLGLQSLDYPKPNYKETHD